MQRTVTALVVVLTLSNVAWAAPAAWYRWKSTESDQTICAQIAPGPGWTVFKGPYEDAQCKKAGNPGSAWK